MLPENNKINRTPMGKGTKISNFTILQILSFGGSCIAYMARNEESGFLYVVKEIFPVKLFEDKKISRLPDGISIVCNNESDAEFCHSMFDKAVELELRNADKIKYLLDNETLNNNPNIFKSYEIKHNLEKNALNRYLAIETEAGECLSSISFPRYITAKERVLDKISTIIRVCESVEKIHKMGLIHCDLKPDNIYISKQCIGDENKISNRFAVLLDFGSAIPIKDDGSIDDSQEFSISSTAGYFPSEIMSAKQTQNYSQIGMHSDVFALCKILMQILCELPINEVTIDSLTKCADIVDMPKNAFEHIIEISKNCLNRIATRKEHYPTVRDFIDDLESVVKDIENAPYIRKSTFIFASDEYFGRIAEQEKLSKILDDSGFAFISGMGGIGKSELAAQYYKKNKHKLSNISKIVYVDDLATAMMTHLQIANIDSAQLENSDEKDRFNYFIEQLENIVNSQTLIVVENFNVKGDINLDRLLNLPCKIIITTRTNFALDSKYKAQTIVLNEEQDKSSLVSLFYANGPQALMPNKEVDIISELIDLVHGHTLTILLLAKHLRESRQSTATGLLEKIRTIGANIDSKTKFVHENDGQQKAMVAYEHIKSIFDFSKITDNEMSMLKVLTFVPPTGIVDTSFLFRCGFNFKKEEGISELNSLVNRGWVIQWYSQDSKENIIALHPIISDVVWNEKMPSISEKRIAEYSKKIMDISLYEKDVPQNYKEIVSEILYFNKRIWEHTCDAVLVYEKSADILGLLHHGKEAFELTKIIKNIQNTQNIAPNIHTQPAIAHQNDYIPEPISDRKASKNHIIIIAGIVLVATLLISIFSTRAMFNATLEKMVEQPYSWHANFVNQTITMDDIKMMKWLPDVYSFDFVDCSFEDGVFDSMINSLDVKTLRLESSSNISSAIETIDEIQTLSIVKPKSNENYIIVEKCTSLKSFEYIANPALENGDINALLGSIKYPDKLETLILNGVSNTDVDLSNFINIKSLNIDNSSSGFYGVENMIYLKTFSAENTYLSSALMLSNATLLEEVNLSSSSVSSLEGLQNSKDTLEKLELSNVGLKDSSQLISFEKLEYLDVSSNSLVELNGLNSVKLGYLDASNNKLTDVEKLSKLDFVQLTYLDLSNNFLTSEQFLNIKMSGGYYAEVGSRQQILLANNKLSLNPIIDTTDSIYIDNMDLSGNDITSFEDIYGVSISNLTIDYSSNIDWTAVKDSAYHVVINNVPLDKVVELEDLFKSSATINKA